MRLKLCEEAVKAKTQKTGSANGSDVKSESGDDPASTSEQEVDAPAGATEPADEPPTPSEAGSGRGKGAGQDPFPKGLEFSRTIMAEHTTYAVKLRTEMVHRVLEGLRDEALNWREVSVSNLLPRPAGCVASLNACARWYLRAPPRRHESSSVPRSAKAHWRHMRESLCFPTSAVGDVGGNF